jgi:hypothetical protein
MFGTISASSARGAGFARRRTRALAGIALWLWSSWVTAAGCCCEPVELAAATVALHPHSASSADEHRHDHGHGHPVPPVLGGLDGSQSQDNVPVDDCTEIKAPAQGIVPKQAAPPSLLPIDHLALVPARLADSAGSWGDARSDWPLPAPPIPPGDPSLETVRLLL